MTVSWEQQKLPQHYEKQKRDEDNDNNGADN